MFSQAISFAIRDRHEKQNEFSERLAPVRGASMGGWFLSRRDSTIVARHEGPGIMRKIAPSQRDDIKPSNCTSASRSESPLPNSAHPFRGGVASQISPQSLSAVSSVARPRPIKLCAFGVPYGTSTSIAGSSPFMTAPVGRVPRRCGVSSVRDQGGPDAPI